MDYQVQGFFLLSYHRAWHLFWDVPVDGGVLCDKGVLLKSATNGHNCAVLLLQFVYEFGCLFKRCM